MDKFKIGDKVINELGQVGTVRRIVYRQEFIKKYITCEVEFQPGVFSRENEVNLKIYVPPASVELTDCLQLLEKVCLAASLQLDVGLAQEACTFLGDYGYHKFGAEMLSTDPEIKIDDWVEDHDGKIARVVKIKRALFGELEYQVCDPRGYEWITRKDNVKKQWSFNLLYKVLLELETVCRQRESDLANCDKTSLLSPAKLLKSFGFDGLSLRLNHVSTREIRFEKLL